MRVRSPLLTLPLLTLPFLLSACAPSQAKPLEVLNPEKTSAPISARLVISDLNQPLFMLPLPDKSGRVLVTERTGAILILDPKTGRVEDTPFLDISKSITTRGEGGVLGLALSPNFADDGTFFLNVTNRKGDTEIRRYAVPKTTPYQADPASENVIMRIEQPYSNHNAGWIGFDPASGLLLIPTGDGGSGGDPLEAGQDPQTLLGKILRIDVTKDSFPNDDLRDYAIPPGNTFTDPKDGKLEIFTMGLRNPWRCSVDPVTGDLFIGDVGQNKVEEIDRLDLTDSSVNFGWDTREGTRRFEGKDDPAFTDPVAEYTHGFGPREGKSLTGGYVYNGPIEALKRHYIFGDYVTGNIWSIPVSKLNNEQTVASADFNILTDALFPDEDERPNITSFGEDADGNLYILSIDGDIYKIEGG